MLVFAFLALVASFLASRLIDLRAAWIAATQLSAGLVVAASLAQVLRFVASGEVVRASIRSGGEETSLLFATALFLASTSAGLILGGAALTIAVSYRWLRERGVGVGPASLGSWLPTALDNAVLVLPTLVGLIAVTTGRLSSPPIAVGSAVTLVTLVAIVGASVVAAKHPERAASFLVGLIRRVRPKRDLSPAHATVIAMLEAPGQLRHGRYRAPLGWATLSVLLDALAMVALFRAASLETSLMVITAGFGLPQLLARIMPIPGGIGVVEAAMIGIYVALGVSHAEAIAVVFAYRLISFWIPRIFGFFAVLQLEHQVRRQS